MPEPGNRETINQTFRVVNSVKHHNIGTNKTDGYGFVVRENSVAATSVKSRVLSGYKLASQETRQQSLKRRLA